jgi:hypothetical protein
MVLPDNYYAMSTQTQQQKTNIVYCIWGYSMTIVEYFEIVKETPKTVVLKKLNDSLTSDGFLSGRSIPLEGSYYKDRDGKYEEIRAYKRTYSNEETFISGKEGFNKYFHRWDGKPRSYNHCD